MRYSVRMIMAGAAFLGLSTAAALSGCRVSSDLQGNWRLVEMGSQPVRAIAGKELPGFTIKDQSIEGFDGCNRFGGRLDQPGRLVSTQMACPNETLRLPLDLTDPMSHLKGGRVENGKLTLPARGDMPASVFQHVD